MFGIVSDMKVAILVVEGVFDSGLTTVQDVLATANTLRAEVPLPPPLWQVSVVGFRRYVHTGNGHRVTTTKPDELDWRPDVLIAPALGFKPAAALIDTVRSPPLRNAVELVKTRPRPGHTWPRGAAARCYWPRRESWTAAMPPPAGGSARNFGGTTQACASTPAPP